MNTILHEYLFFALLLYIRFISHTVHFEFFSSNGLWGELPFYCVLKSPTQIVVEHPYKARLEESFNRCLMINIGTGNVALRQASEDFRKLYEEFSLLCKALRM